MHYKRYVSTTLHYKGYASILITGMLMLTLLITAIQQMAFSADDRTVILSRNPSPVIINRNAIDRTFKRCKNPVCRLTFDRKEAPDAINASQQMAFSADDRTVILWYNPSQFIINRNAINRTFDGCKNPVCRLTFDRKEAPYAKVVIFNGRMIQRDYRQFVRPRDQLWVWWSNEPPSKYIVKGKHGTGWSKLPFVNAFNFTMTYNRKSEIYVPYGEIVLNDSPPSKHFTTVIARKKRPVLWIASNCHTFSWREEYVKELRKYIDVDINGECSDELKPWDCGTRHLHDECFAILNNYYFFLAFENGLCEDYISEKFFENFKYDTVLVSRGGLKYNFKELLPKDVYIDVSDFDSPEVLAKHLHDLMNDVTKYTSILENKIKYRNVAYPELYQRGLCDLCDYVSTKTTKFEKKYDNIRDLFHERNHCRLPNDMPHQFE